MNELLASFDISGRVALVTGASSGFGRHFAEVLARAGAKVVLASRRLEVVEDARDEIVAAGGTAMAVAMDVTDSASIAAALDNVEARFGVVTIVINNAGITIPKLLLDLSDEDWNAVVDTNLNGVAFVTRECARRMVAAQSGGSIVNIASILAIRSQHMLTNYAAAKAGVTQFTKTAALELAVHNIRVNAICPGYFATEMIREWLKTDAAQTLVERIPQRRVGELDEMNGTLLLLASDASSHMTGAEIVIDGGHVLADL
ncbi:glucose 1-dehydrogenase [Seongchinamella unica]|uniref:Glucose 1-dehydrogenase n=1 Tax=Seongchinamella unica TaxID=2547392 RepID=A0A4R5LU18_9GAMM|nr:glucose 1-dehydrogenase [Seongchinamella unica]TDG14850.1 glucose 1-dehydrogenase [Seongchinamella unica]